MNFTAENLVNILEIQMSNLRPGSSIAHDYAEVKAVREMLLSIYGRLKKPVKLEYEIYGYPLNFWVYPDDLPVVRNRVAGHKRKIDRILGEFEKTFRMLVGATSVDWVKKDLPDAGTIGFTLEGRLFLQDYMIAIAPGPRIFYDERAELEDFGTNSLVRTMFPERDIAFFKNEKIACPDTMLLVAGRICISDYIRRNPIASGSYGSCLDL